MKSNLRDWIGLTKPVPANAFEHLSKTEQRDLHREWENYRSLHGVMWMTVSTIETSAAIVSPHWAKIVASVGLTAVASFNYSQAIYHDASAKAISDEIDSNEDESATGSAVDPEMSLEEEQNNQQASLWANRNEN